MSETICKICSSKDVEIFHSGTRESNAKNLLRCFNCGVGFLSDFDHITPDHYSQDGILRGANKGGDTIVERLKHFDLETKERFERVRGIIANKDILDFGCGAGGFLSLAKYMARSVTGVEPSYSCIDFLRQSGIKCLPDLVRVEEKGNGQFDLIFSFHVFEHLKDPLGNLIKLRELLRGSGRIYIEVPNFDDVFFDTYWNEDYLNFNINNAHLFYFNKRSLTYLANQACMKIVAVEYIQRYSLANHLHWLAFGQPGGHKEWFYLDTPGLNKEYSAMLKGIGKTDAIAIILEL